MKNYTYHFEVQSLVAQFMAALDDIIIKRYNDAREPKEAIKVRFVYSPKQRVLHDLTDKAQNTQLPVVAVSIGQITRDTTRVYNKIAGSNFRESPTDKKQTGFLPQPLPIDLAINVDFIAKYTEDIDQIITNFVPYCDPYFVISWRIPEMNDYELRSIVMWSGSVAVTYPNDLAPTTNARVVGSTQFTIKGWLFKPIERTPLIYNITTNLKDLKANYGIGDSETYDIIHTYGKPAPASLVPTHIQTPTANTQIVLYGDMFKLVTAVYLTGDAVSHLYETYAPFSTSVHMSAQFVPFEAYKLDVVDYVIENESKMIITIPIDIEKGYIDIIVENPVGYTSFVNHVNRFVELYTYDKTLIPPGLIITE